MKKTVLSILCVLLSVGALFAQNLDPNPNLDFNVEIHPIKTPKPTIKPKTIVINDIEAYYSYRELSFKFNVDLGSANIVITNTTTGESWCDSINGAGATTVTLSVDEGYYEIYIYTDCGDYTGAFVI